MVTSTAFTNATGMQLCMVPSRHCMPSEDEASAILGLHKGSAASAVSNSVHEDTHSGLTTIILHRRHSHGRTVVTVDGRKAPTKIDPHKFEANCGYLLNGVDSNGMFPTMACPDSLARCSCKLYTILKAHEAATSALHMPTVMLFDTSIQTLPVSRTYIS